MSCKQTSYLNRSFTRSYRYFEPGFLHICSTVRRTVALTRMHWYGYVLFSIQTLQCLQYELSVTLSVRCIYFLIDHSYRYSYIHKMVSFAGARTVDTNTLSIIISDGRHMYCSEKYTNLDVTRLRLLVSVFRGLGAVVLATTRAMGNGQWEMAIIVLKGIVQRCLKRYHRFHCRL
jgi:hypothetical protein